MSLALISDPSHVDACWHGDYISSSSLLAAAIHPPSEGRSKHTASKRHGQSHLTLTSLRDVE